MGNTFYDIHMHAMNLSHPNLLAFLRRFKGKLKLALLANIFLGPVISFLLIKFFRLENNLKKMQNLLAVMENDMGSFFLLLEECLKHSDNPLLIDDELRIGSKTYKKVVLCPLMMDFGYKDIKRTGVHYGPPRHELWQKPIVEQVIDVFNGIRKYMESEKSDKIFEIYPFLGLNTKNYSEEDEEKEKEVEKLLEKYFANYNHSRQDLAANLGKFNGNIDAMGGNFFAGVKVYPPLGFDPWPVREEYGSDKEHENELKKVKKLYGYCRDKEIPVISHCSEGGFAVAKKMPEYTNPAKWETVLKEYPKLKLCLAHFGWQNRWLMIFPITAWQKTILNLINKYDNVYADFSYSGVNANYYKTLRKIIDGVPVSQREKLKDRIIFGTDYMINLGKIESYNKYLDIYSKTTEITPAEKEKFCNINPDRFLWM